MKVVIDIPEEYKTLLDDGDADGSVRKSVLLAVSNGKPLPEGHGRLIDEQQIIDRFKPIEKFKYWRIGLDGLFIVLRNAPTIIEGNSLKEYYNDKNADSYVGFDNEDNEALDMAIKALEQQPCEDCISREEAIKEFQVYREYSSNMSNVDWVDRIEKVLTYLPPVKPQQKIDEIIKRIEETRDKDKLCEYPYNRCIKIIREVLGDD